MNNIIKKTDKKRIFTAVLFVVLLLLCSCNQKHSETPEQTSSEATTGVPETEFPVTEPPATEPPVTEPPVTEPSATEPPVTEPPVTEPPVTEPPVIDDSIKAEQYGESESFPDYSLFPEITDGVGVVGSTAINDKITVDYIKGKGNPMQGYSGLIAIETDNGYEFYDILGAMPRKCEAHHVNTTVEFMGTAYYVDFLWCEYNGSVVLINDDCSLPLPQNTLRTAPVAIEEKTDAVILMLYSSGEYLTQYPLLFKLADYSFEDAFGELGIRFAYPQNEQGQPEPSSEEQEAEQSEPIVNITLIQFNRSLSHAVIMDELSEKIYLLSVASKSLTELPSESYMHWFIDEGYLFYVISEYDGSSDKTSGYCMDLQTNTTDLTLSTDLDEPFDIRFIKNSAYALVIYSNRSTYASVVNLISGEVLLLSGYDFNLGMTVAVNSTMTHIIFSNIDDNLVTKDLAILCLQSHSFTVLKTSGECQRFELDGAYFIADNKIAIMYSLQDDREHFYLSVYTFGDFFTHED